MEVKDILKSRRTELSYTMKDLAALVGVSEGTISRWESGDIENMRRDKIAALAKALQISPAVIMGWDENELGRPRYLRPDESTLLSNYNTLNDTGKDKAQDYVEDLTDNPKYTSERPYLMPIAAHGRPGEDPAEDLHLMDDPEIWNK